MKWSERYRWLKVRSGDPGRKKAEPVSVRGLCDIPPDATPDKAFRVTVEVVRVAERATKEGPPCYFLSLKDADGVRFTVVCWDWQWERLEGVAEGSPATLDVRVPAEDYESFTLA